MKLTQTVAVILAVALATPVWAEQAARRGTSSSKSSNSDEKKSGGDSRPATSSSSHSSKRSGSDSRPSRPSSGGTSVYVPSAPSRPLTDAERRHPRPGTGHAYDGRGRGGHYDGRGRGRVLVGHYGPHYHGRLYYPHSCYDHRTTFIYYDTPYYRHVYHYYDRDGAIRVLVDPAETKVFVDGYYAGEADDFDGIFQRLYVSPGRHDITLKLDGYRSQRFRVYVPRGRTLKLHHDMVAGDGEVVADLTTDEDAAGEETVGADDDAPAPEESDDRGTLVLNVTPEDASVYVDGEFHGTGRNSESLTLPAGRHQIEVVRPGFKTYEREVEVRPGRTLELEVDLRRS